MKEKPKIRFVVFSLAVLLLSAGTLHADPMKRIENFRGEFVLVPMSAPEKNQLVLVSSVKLARKAEIIGALALYDDPQTKRPVDYWQLYDRTGSLLLISWVDRFGILGGRPIDLWAGAACSIYMERIDADHANFRVCSALARRCDA